jgi:hypothetical protein
MITCNKQHANGQLQQITRQQSPATNNTLMIGLNFQVQRLNPHSASLKLNTCLYKAFRETTKKGSHLVLLSGYKQQSGRKIIR